jgi:hypothetical protein|tara:strand:- start:114 stop:323 length:210 start_codon:yes stop_codon:yes gene_type:complete
MIKKIKNFICKLFGIKQCACPEDDEHIEYYTKVPEPEIPVHKDENTLHCSSHLRFRKTCPRCLEIVGVK